ncbi:hypothetical protein [Haloparvum sp. PAK95]|uniref:hypothetical protein n=1 Tax=Haloparvum sp. PAK95 TaxID=3418962 RepID=UPI003D2F1EEA
MVENRHRALHQFVMERAGDSYRTAFYYHADGWETLHVREDVATEQLEESVPKAVERAREKRAFLRGEEYPPLGDTTATTEVHENGVIIHFPEKDREGVLISLDRDAAQKLASFVDQAISVLETHTSEYRTESVTD